MNFWTALFLATLCLVVAIAVLATKFLFPHHRLVAFVVYGIGWLPFLYSIYLKKEWFLSHQLTVMNLFTAFWIHLVFAAILLFVLYVFLVLFPVAKSPFIGLSDEQVEQYLAEDQTLVLYLDQRLQTLFQEADEQELFSVKFSSITGEEKESLNRFWISYLEVMLELDLLKERYKTFYQLNVVTQNDLHRDAFSIGYAALLTQIAYTIDLQAKVENQQLITYFDQSIAEQGIEKGTYTAIVDTVSDSDELLRLNTGRAYYNAIRTEGESIDQLIIRHVEQIDSLLREYTALVASKPLDLLERNAFKLWFPLQKKSALSISYIRTTDREYHVTPEQIASYKSQLQPGDIMLQRREWHATNVGIPGYWTHAAMYLGDIAYLDEYFSGMPELQGITFSQYVKENFPKVFSDFTTVDEKGFAYSVIEAKRPGVILMSLEASANADSVAVLRVTDLSRSDQFKIVTQSFTHYGKPYDYDFNFVTDDALVCSELVYKAYQDLPQFSVQLQEFNGRPIVSPNQFATQFDVESGKDSQTFSLVFFLDGNEKEGLAVERNEKVFAESWSRPKWHIVNDFVQTEN